MKKTEGKLFDPSEGSIFFLAAPFSGSDMVQYHERLGTKDILVAANECTQSILDCLRSLIKTNGCRLLLDSGVFALTMQHARKHGVHMNAALALAPDVIEGFDELLERYEKLITEFRSSVWGYIELDQGGADNKRKTRAKLEAKGLRPIPVYHPLNDGWAYFDELAQQYDRICLGNVVFASPKDRVRIMHTLIDRRRKYPKLWIHGLGVTTSPLLCPFPLNSTDSSVWMDTSRWGIANAFGGFNMNWRLPNGYVPQRKATSHLTPAPLQAYKSCMLGAYIHTMAANNLRAYHKEIVDAGLA